MCEPRYWKTIRSYINSNEAWCVSALRSDGVLFEFRKKEFSSTPSELVFRLVVNTINELEEYRSCECSLGIRCKKHQEQTNAINSSSVSSS